MKSKSDIIHELNQAEQARGNLTVLFTNSISEKIGLSATEFECLDLIGDHQPITAGQLARLTGLSSGGVTGVVDRLEQAGYVRRRRDPIDRRRVLLDQVFDRKIVNRIRKLYEPMTRTFEDICQHYTAAELAVILRYEQATLRRVQQLLDEK